MSESSEFHPLDEFPARLSKAAKRQARRAEQAAKKDPSPIRADYKPLEAKTPRQKRYIQALKADESAIAIGGAGTGKTYVAARVFAKKLIDGKTDRIVVARVAVSKAKHALGFLPGKLDAKLAPWLVPVIEGIRAEIKAQAFEQLKEAGAIEFASFEHMRGRTFSNSCVLLDEAQNADFGDLKLVLTRWGESTQYAVTGDMDQIDVHDSGLETVLDIVEAHDVPIHIIEFTDEDVVRSPMAKSWVKAFKLHAINTGTDRSCRPRKVYAPQAPAPANADDVNLDALPAFLDNGLVTKPVA